LWLRARQKFVIRCNLFSPDVLDSRDDLLPLSAGNLVREDDVLLREDGGRLMEDGGRLVKDGGRLMEDGVLVREDGVPVRMVGERVSLGGRPVVLGVVGVGVLRGRGKLLIVGSGVD